MESTNLDEIKYNTTILSKPLQPEDSAAWKSAMYMVKFMKESSLNDFFLAYYGDKDGNPTVKSDAWKIKPKKEKVAKLRELLSELPEDIKWSIVNSQAGREIDKKSDSFGGKLGAASIGATVSSIPLMTKLVSWVNPLAGVLWGVGISALLGGTEIARKIIAKNKKGSINRDYLINQLVQERGKQTLKEGVELSIEDYLLEDYKRFCKELERSKYGS